tara:strand:+ start:355 stop:630 length:276 start_codon:yes stop_codon:yes gene_type:complete
MEQILRRLFARDLPAEQVQRDIVTIDKACTSGPEPFLIGFRNIDRRETIGYSVHSRDPMPEQASRILRVELPQLVEQSLALDFLNANSLGW